jgi:hypothetical protein
MDSHHWIQTSYVYCRVILEDSVLSCLWFVFMSEAIVQNWMHHVYRMRRDVVLPRSASGSNLYTGKNARVTIHKCLY